MNKFDESDIGKYFTEDRGKYMYSIIKIVRFSNKKCLCNSKFYQRKILFKSLIIMNDQYSIHFTTSPTNNLHKSTKEEIKLFNRKEKDPNTDACYNNCRLKNMKKYIKKIRQERLKESLHQDIKDLEEVSN